MKLHLLAIVSAAAVLAVAGCGSSSSSSSSPQATKTATPAPKEVSPAGDIPDNQVFVTYQAAGAPFSVKVPEGWSQTEHGGVVTFTDKLNSIALAWGAAPK